MRYSLVEILLGAVVLITAISFLIVGMQSVNNQKDGYNISLIFGSTEEGRSIEKAVLGGADADNATALSLNHTVSQVTTASSKTHVSLADGVLGQVKIITHFGKVGDHDLVITPVNFANGTNDISRSIAKYSKKNGLISVAGGGDTFAAIKKSNQQHNFTYISTAGGAFLEWLEGKMLPGLKVLENN